MIQCERFDTTTGAITTIAPDDVFALLAQPDALVWVDLRHPTDAELDWLGKTFAFHPLSLEDARKGRQRAKLEEYDGYLFFVLHGVGFKPNTHHMATYEVDAFIGRGYLVTVHANGAAAIDSAHARWQKTPLPHVSAALLFYLVLDDIIDGYFPVLDELGEQIDKLDQAVFVGVDRAMLRGIFALRRSLLVIRKQLGPIRDALNELLRIESEPIFTLAHAREYFTDVYDHVLRLTDFTDTYRDMLASSMEAYQSSLSNQLNVNMQRLTVIATILATWSVVTGFYGMNLRGMFIGVEAPIGAPLVFWGLVVVSVIELIIFRRKGWL